MENVKISNAGDNKGLNKNENMTTTNAVSQNDFSFNGTPIDRSMEQVNQNNNVLTLKKQRDNKTGNFVRAGFVKFPVFLLIIMVIGAIGIFIGKMFYTFLSQQ